jgi:hypothetical protein
MAEEDKRVRAELTRDGSQFVGHHPRMEAVHVAHAHSSPESKDALAAAGVQMSA